MPIWFIFALIALVLWGVWGFFTKVATDRFANPLNVLVFEAIGYIVVVIAVLAYRNFRLEFSVPGIVFSILAGLFTTLATIGFLFALSRGKASVVVPLTSLYPLVTIVLALLILREPMTLKQGAGIVLALIALLLFAL